MAVPIKIILRIKYFCNCEGCIKAIKKTCHELGDVILLEINEDKGEVAVYTSKQPEVIQSALRKKLSRDVTILQGTTTVPNSSPAFNNSHNNTNHQTRSSLKNPQGDIDINDLAEAIKTVSYAKGLQNVKYTQSSTLEFNFNNPNNQPSTSGSAPTSHKRGSSDAYFEEVPPMSPPETTTKPSAPLIPNSQANEYPTYWSPAYGTPTVEPPTYGDYAFGHYAYGQPVFGHPANYGHPASFFNSPQSPKGECGPIDCCTIL